VLRLVAGAFSLDKTGFAEPLHDEIH